MIKTKMGVASVICNVLKLTPKEVEFSKIKIGQYFECEGDIYVKTDNVSGVSINGENQAFGYSLVKPLNISIE